MKKIIVNSIADLENLNGKVVGVSDYHTITQEQIQQFADATLDQQWIHTDPKKAELESPFKTTIAHGYLTLSLAPYFLSQIMEINNATMAVNYGVEKLRFMEAVKVNSRLRMQAEFTEVKNLRGTVRCSVKMTFEIENVKKPACVAEAIFLYRFS